MFFFANVDNKFFHTLSYSPKKFLIARLKKQLMYLVMQKDEEYIPELKKIGLTEIEKDIYRIQIDKFVYILELVEDLNLRRQIYDSFHDYEYTSIKQESQIYNHIELLYKDNIEDEMFIKTLKENYPTLNSFLNQFMSQLTLEQF